MHCHVLTLILVLTKGDATVLHKKPLLVLLLQVLAHWRDLNLPGFYRQAESAQRNLIGKPLLPLCEEEEEVVGALPLGGLDVPPQLSLTAFPRLLMPTPWTKNWHKRCLTVQEKNISIRI